MATETKPSGSRVRSSNQDGSSSKGKVDYSSVNKKKIDSSIRPHFSDSRQLKSASNLSKIEVKSKTTSSSSKIAPSSSKTALISLKTTTTTTTRVREKKVFTLPGQKFDPPEEREPLRIFYESLWKQIPTSEMAEFWMMEHGLLSPDRAKKAHERKQRKQMELRLGLKTPIKTPNLTTSRPESSQRQQQASKNGDAKAKKRIIKDSDDDDDFILSPKRRKG
ncbi:hypothetical protein Dsin_017688 [Dipteronia sinensis]|uniref:Uncharacterized protein n=1 Tax=Dipteronia sinensis TaxID=43782 RepID=A0AAE0AGQ3_9ROSI|nr:hypothetical protein Dsin_017688 [Dipteronia sinensis]